MKQCELLTGVNGMTLGSARHSKDKIEDSFRHFPTGLAVRNGQNC